MKQKIPKYYNVNNFISSLPTVLIRYLIFVDGCISDRRIQKNWKFPFMKFDPFFF